MPHPPFTSPSSQRQAVHNIGLGLGFSPAAVHSLSSHIQPHPFGQFSTITGFPLSNNHSSPISSSYNLHVSAPPVNSAANSLNLPYNRKNQIATSTVDGMGNLKSRSAAPSPAHSSSSIPNLPKHYVQSQKYHQDTKKHIASTIAPTTYECYTNSSSNRNSSNHSNSTTNSHFNAESVKTDPTLVPVDQTFVMLDSKPKITTTQIDLTKTDDCKYSISLEKVNKSLVTSNEKNKIPSEPMESSNISCDAPTQAKFIFEQISPRKLLLSSDNNKLNAMTTTHLTDDDDEELNNGCQERLNDLSGRRRHSPYDSYQQQLISDASRIEKTYESEGNANCNKQKQTHTGNQPINRSPENMTNTNRTSLEHDTTTITNSDIDNKKLSEVETNINKFHGDIAHGYNIWRDNDTLINQSTGIDAAQSTNNTMKLPQTTHQNLNSIEESNREKILSNCEIPKKLPTDANENPNNSKNMKKSSEMLTTEDGIAVENTEHIQPKKS